MRSWALDLRGRVMHELSHGTSAKRMAHVRAVLRHDPQGGRNSCDNEPRTERVAPAARCTNHRWLNGLDESARCRAFSHLAPFILPSLGRRSALRRPCAALRQTAIRQKLRSSMSGAGCVQLDCSFYADSLMDERASRIAASTEGRTQELRLSCPLFGRSYAGRRPADGSRSNVVMSGVVDSGRES
jgi:hypothetical protein